MADSKTNIMSPNDVLVAVKAILPGHDYVRDGVD